MTIRSITCRVKPENPQLVGWKTWEAFIKSRREQEALPLDMRCRPCHRQTPFSTWWCIVQVPWCMKCEDSEWHIEIGDRLEITNFKSRNGKVVELVSQETGEVFRYEIGKGFVNENPAAA